MNKNIATIDLADLAQVTGGCNCGCGMTDCNCTNGSCTTTTTPTATQATNGIVASQRRRPFTLPR